MEPPEQKRDAILKAEGLTKTYPVKRGWFETRRIKALNGVDFVLEKGKTLAVIGESGCGKTTLAKQILGMETPDEGEIHFEGQPVPPASKRSKTLIRKIQLVFQNPYASLNPRQSVGSILEDPLILHTGLGKEERRERVRRILRKTGMEVEHAERYPHMFSGGQRQRIAVARAIITGPELLVLDEPVSALDLSVQAQVLNLLKDLQDEFGLTYLFITHNISVMRFFADHVMVMYLGRCVEFGSAEQILEAPRHPYTKILLDSSPSLLRDANRKRMRMQGELPSPLDPPAGCPFRTRCPLKQPLCETTFPPATVENERKFHCHFPESWKTDS